MYYQEKIINGVLCNRFSPNAEFKPFTFLEQLTERIQRQDKRILELNERLTGLK